MKFEKYRDIFFPSNGEYKSKQTKVIKDIISIMKKICRQQQIICFQSMIVTILKIKLIL